MIKILALTGSLREGSYNKRVLKIAIEGAKRAGAEVTIIDLRDLPMPIYNADDQEKNGFDANAMKFQDLLKAHDGLLIASPEYNGSIPGGLKNAIDWASRKSEKYGMGEVFKGKCAAMITASPGSFGGIRCLGHLRGVLSILGINVLPSEIAVTFAGEKFAGDSDEMTDEKMRSILEKLGAALVDMMKKTHGDVKFVSDTSS
ncbi:MAG: NAD(P)H-dependent oxidoreductase [Pyrinomonadaceae bacterium]